jgi:polyisoprenoid-binding protein YceI
MVCRRCSVLSALAFAGLLQVGAGTAASAAERSFAAGGDDQNSNLTSQSETDFETILGRTQTALETVTVDLEAGTGSVDVRVPVPSLDTGIELRNEHLQASDWLDARKAPEFLFVSRSARELEDVGWEIAGDFTLHGVSKPLTARAQVKLTPAEAAKAAGLGKGDWLRVSVPCEKRALRACRRGAEQGGRPRERLLEGEAQSLRQRAELSQS